MEKRRNRPPTIHDVARAAAVSVMTVSRVLNNHPSVKTITRDRVNQAIADIGYAPNDAARMLKGRSARTIALIVPSLSDFYSTCFQAVQAIAITHGYQTLVAVSGRNAATEDQQLEAFRNYRVSGIILVSVGGEDRNFNTLRESNIPIVALDRPIPGLATDAVLVENLQGAELGVRHLIEHGHTSIACVSYEFGSHTIQQRIAGYTQAMQSAGLQPALFTLAGRDDLRALVANWAAAPAGYAGQNNSAVQNTLARPTAVFTTKRIVSVQLIEALHRHAIRIPQDIAIVGFDDFELAEVLSTPLTTIRQSPTDIARAAADLLFKKIIATESATTPNPENPNPENAAPTNTTTYFPAELILRSSCGCPPKD